MPTIMLLLGDKAQSLKTNYIKEMKSIKTKAEIEHYKKCLKEPIKHFRQQENS